MTTKCPACGKIHMMNVEVDHDTFIKLEYARARSEHNTKVGFIRTILTQYLNKPEEGENLKRMRVKREDVMNASDAQIKKFKKRYDLKSHSREALIEELEDYCDFIQVV